MRKLLILITFVSSLILLPSTSYADWKIVSKSVDGDNFYVDFERIKKHKGLVYYWALTDYLKPDMFGDLSGKGYVEADCVRFRSKYLTSSFHTKPMGEGTPSTTVNEPDKEWVYPSPDSPLGIKLKAVCNHKP